MKLINNNLAFIREYVSTALATLLETGIGEIMDNKKDLNILNKECILFIVEHNIHITKNHEFVIKDLFNSVRDKLIRVLNESMDNELQCLSFL